MFAVYQIPILAAALSPIPTSSSYWSPGNLFWSWVEDGSDITVAIADWPGLTAALADATTGDARKVIVGFCEQAFTWYNGLATPPTAIELTYSPGRFQTFGDYIGKQRVEYKVVAYLDFPSLEVADEV